MELFAGCEYLGDRTFVSRVSGRRYDVPDSCRIVDARYLAPAIPAEDPPHFEVLDGARVVPVNALAHLDEAPSQYVVVGSGKTATDACVWLLGRGVDPDAICWVRPRDPWMLNRAVVQPDPAVYLAMVATMLESGAASASLDEVFLRLEDAGVMLRIDPAVMPRWPRRRRWGSGARPPALDLRRGPARPPPLRLARPPPPRLRHRVGPPRRPRRQLRLRRPQVPPAPPDLAGRRDHAAARPRRLPVLRRRGDRLRRGHPPRAPRRRQEPALRALVARQLARRLGPHERPRHPQPPSTAAEPDTREWINTVALNPARVPPTHPSSAALSDAQERLAAATEPALAQLARLAAGA